MSEHTRPVPPDQRSPKGPAGKGAAGDKAALNDDPKTMEAEKANPEQRGRTGNSKINTTHQGYQQDR